MSARTLRTILRDVGLLGIGAALGATMLMSNIAARAMDVGRADAVVAFPVGSGGPRSLAARSAAREGVRTAAVADLARAAVRSSPVNYPAFEAMALLDPRRAGTMLRHAAHWTRRDPDMLLAVYRQQIDSGDRAAAIETADALLRLQVHDEAIYPDIGRRLGDPRFRGMLADHMARAPGWRGRFFAMIPATPANAGSLVDIADRVEKRGPALSRHELAPLLSGLVRLGPEPTRQAHALWQRRFAPANSLAWPDEAAAVVPLPFDWSIPEELRGSVWFGDNALTYSLQAGQPVVARKMAVLAPGTYRLAYAPDEQVKIRWSILCLDGGPAVIVEDHQSFTLPAGCIRQVIELKPLSNMGKIGTVSARALR